MNILPISILSLSALRNLRVLLVIVGLMVHYDVSAQSEPIPSDTNQVLNITPPTTLPEETSSKAPEEKVLASAAAPMSLNQGKWNASHWQDETVENQPVLFMIRTSGNGMFSAKILNEIPSSGPIMIRVKYFSKDGSSGFSVGVGGWGSPTIQIYPRKKGWSYGEVVLQASEVLPEIREDQIPMLISTGENVAISQIELIQPTKEHVLNAFKEFVSIQTERAVIAANTGNFIKVDDYDDKTPLNPTESNTQSGVIPFIRNYLIPIYPASIPIPAERVLEGKVQFTPGEYEPFQLGVKALKDFPECKAEVVGDLPAGLEAEIDWVECVPIRTKGTSSAKSWHLQPNRLWRKEINPTCSVKKQMTQSWWILFHASDTLGSGTYPIQVAIKNGSQDLATFTIQVKILPFTLPKKIDYAYGLYEERAVNDVILEDMAAHGCNSLSAWSHFMPIRDSTNDFTFWDTYFASLKKFGMDYSFIWFVGTKENGFGVEKSMGDARVIQALRDLDTRVKRGDYPKNFALTIDEAVRSPSSWKDIHKLFDWMEKNSPSLKKFGVSLNKHVDAVKHDGMIDILSCNGEFDANSAWATQKKIPLYTYTVFSGRTSASSSRYNSGFNPWRYHASGTYGWALRWYTEEPFNDLDGPSSDYGLILPNWVGKPTSTPAWEAWREGVDDRRYIEVYSQLVKDHRAPEKLLEEIRKDLKEDMLSNEEKVGDSIFEALLNEANKLDHARERLIQGILEATSSK